MKKKVLIPIFVMLLLAVGAFCAFLIAGRVVPEEETTENYAIDITAQVMANSSNAFSFLKKSENILPDDARGYVVDTSEDIDFSVTTEAALKAAAEDVFTKVDAIQPNTVVIKHYKDTDYSPSGFDVLSHLITKAKELHQLKD